MSAGDSGRALNDAGLDAPAIPSLRPLLQARLLPRAFLVALLVALFGAGLAVRVLPLLGGRDLLLRQPTEDGYLMLTVARNMAVGLGMSTAEGTMPTNGVQPLATGLFSIPFVLSHGDKAGGVAWVMWISVLISLLAARAMFRLGRALFAGRADEIELSLLAAAAWFASPIVAMHAMNALETGLYLLVLASVLRFFILRASDPDQDLTRGSAVGLGAWLGLAFWARNDAIFLAAAIGITRLALSRGRPAALLFRRVRELAVVAAVMGALAAPWMISNWVRFGSIVPISGKAEATDRLGANLPTLPAKLAESLTVVGAIPNPLEPRPVVVLACMLLVLAGVAAAVAAIRRGSPAVRTGALLGLVHGGMLALYYGVFFGAAHFLSRYTAPVSILCAFLTVAVLTSWLRARGLRIAVWSLMGLLAVGLDARGVRMHDEHMHFQVVDWVEQHVPADVWVGAVQSGTVGFFHDRTINLDGKMNPAALAARGPQKMRPYILSTSIRYLADWSGLESWGSWLAPDFQVIVDDKATNLAVLERVR